MSDRKLGLAGLSLQIDLIERIMRHLAETLDELHADLRAEKERIKDARAARRLARG